MWVLGHTGLELVRGVTTLHWLLHWSAHEESVWHAHSWIWLAPSTHRHPCLKLIGLWTTHHIWWELIHYRLGLLLLLLVGFEDILQLKHWIIIRGIKCLFLRNSWLRVVIQHVELRWRRAFGSYTVGWWTSDGPTSKEIDQVVVTGVGVVFLFILLFILSIKVCGFQVLYRVNLCVLTWDERFHRLFTFYLLKSLERLLQILIDQKQASCHVFIFCCSYFFVEFWLHFFQSFEKFYDDYVFFEFLPILTIIKHFIGHIDIAFQKV